MYALGFRVVPNSKLRPSIAPVSGSRSARLARCNHQALFAHVQETHLSGLRMPSRFREALAQPFRQAKADCP